MGDCVLPHLVRMGVVEVVPRGKPDGSSSAPEETGSEPMEAGLPAGEMEFRLKPVDEAITCAHEAWAKVGMQADASLRLP